MIFAPQRGTEFQGVLFFLYIHSTLFVIIRASPKNLKSIGVCILVYVFRSFASLCSAQDDKRGEGSG